MNFMEKDEYLLLMVHCPDRGIDTDTEYVLSISDRQRLRSVGIKTAHEQPPWSNIEPSKGNYDFTVINDILHKNRAADLKSLLYVTGWRLPEWIPNEWRARTKDGIYERETLSMWNEEAQKYSDRHYKMLMSEFCEPDIIWISGEWQGGEGAYPATWALYDDAAIQDYKKVYGTSSIPEPNNPDTLDWFGKKVIQHFVRKAKILYPRWHEVWNMQQHLMDTWTKSFGNFVQVDIMREYRKLWPDGSIVLLQCTYYDDAHKEDNVIHVDMLREISGCETIVEAMFSRGLPYTTPRAIAHGFRGQIIRPANEPGRTRLEDWEVENIRVSHEAWRRSKGL